MALSNEMQKVATDLINKFGSTVILKKPSSSNYDIASGRNIVADGTQISHKANIESYSSEEIKGLVQSGDIRIMIATTDYVSVQKDKIIFNSIEYNIINVEPLYLQDAVIAQTLQVRR